MTDALFPSHRGAALQGAIDQLANNDETERGAVYTKPEVVRTILDLAGYTPDQPLHSKRILEPSFGGGDFLLAVVDRLLSAFGLSGGTPSGVLALIDAVLAVRKGNMNALGDCTPGHRSPARRGDASLSA